VGNSRGGDLVEVFRAADDHCAGDAEVHEGVCEDAAKADVAHADDPRLEALRKRVVDGVDERAEKVEDCSVGEGAADGGDVLHCGVVCGRKEEAECARTCAVCFWLLLLLLRAGGKQGEDFGGGDVCQVCAERGEDVCGARRRRGRSIAVLADLDATGCGEDGRRGGHVECIVAVAARADNIDQAASIPPVIALAPLLPLPLLPHHRWWWEASVQPRNSNPGIPHALRGCCDELWV